MIPGCRIKTTEMILRRVHTKRHLLFLHHAILLCLSLAMKHGSRIEEHPERMETNALRPNVSIL